MTTLLRGTDLDWLPVLFRGLNRIVTHTSAGTRCQVLFNGLAILQPDGLLVYTEQCSYCAQSFPPESTCLVGLYLQLLGLRSQAGIWSRSLGGLKTPHKRACKSAGRTILTSALLHLISLSFSLSLYMLDFDVFLAQKTAKCNYGLTLKGGESLRQRHKHVYCDAKNVFTHLFHALLFTKI